MYGLVNQAVKELVIKSYGQDKWEKISDKAGFKEKQFVAMKQYPDQLTYQLVFAASEILNVEAEKILNAFGEHWILFTAQEGYGDMLDCFLGTSLETSLINLNSLHARLGIVMSELTPPSFVVKKTADSKILLEYHSTRQGLAPMVVGLLNGLAKKFNNKISVKTLPALEKQNFVRFEIEIEK